MSQHGSVSAPTQNGHMSLLSSPHAWAPIATPGATVPPLVGASSAAGESELEGVGSSLARPASGAHHPPQSRAGASAAYAPNDSLELTPGTPSRAASQGPAPELRAVGGSVGCISTSQPVPPTMPHPQRAVAPGLDADADGGSSEATDYFSAGVPSPSFSPNSTSPPLQPQPMLGAASAMSTPPAAAGRGKNLVRSRQDTPELGDPLTLPTAGVTTPTSGSGPTHSTPSLRRHAPQPRSTTASLEHDFSSVPTLSRSQQRSEDRTAAAGDSADEGRDAGHTFPLPLLKGRPRLAAGGRAVTEDRRVPPVAAAAFAVSASGLDYSSSGTSGGTNSSGVMQGSPMVPDGDGGRGGGRGAGWPVQPEASFFTADEENGELAGTFHNRFPSIAAAPALEHTDSFEGTFGTFVSTMSTTVSAGNTTSCDFATTVTSTSAPMQDAQRAQATREMRQVLLQTLGLSFSDSSGSGSGQSRPTGDGGLASGGAGTDSHHLSATLSSLDATAITSAVLQQSPSQELSAAQAARPHLRRLNEGSVLSAWSVSPTASPTHSAAPPMPLQGTATSYSTGQIELPHGPSSSDGSVPEAAQAEVPPPQRLSLIGTKARFTLENAGGRLDGISSTTAMSPASPALRRRLTVDNHFSPRSSDGTFGPRTAAEEQTASALGVSADTASALSATCQPLDRAAVAALLELSSHSLSNSGSPRWLRPEEDDDVEESTGTATTVAHVSATSSVLHLRPGSGSGSTAAYGDAVELRAESSFPSSAPRWVAASASGDAFGTLSSVPTRRTSHIDPVTAGSAAGEPLDSGSSRVWSDSAATRSDPVTATSSATWSPSLRPSARTRGGTAAAAAGLTDANAGAAVQLAEDDDDACRVPATRSAALPAAGRHVSFANAESTQFVEPPPSPWGDDDLVYTPDYTYMEYIGSDAASPVSNGDDVDPESEAAVMQSVPRFRFRPPRANALAPSPREVRMSRLTTSAWPPPSRSSDRGSAAAASGGEGDAATSGSAESRAPGRPSTGGEEEGDEGGHAAATERAPRVFFTKERLASRAALMQARRPGGQQTSGSTEAVAALSQRPVPVSRPPPRHQGGGYSIRLAPPPPPASAPQPPPAAASTIALSLPGFAAPGPQGSHDSAVQPQSTSSPAAVDDDGFGGWVHNSQPTAAPAAPVPLTKERCAQLLAAVHDARVPVPGATPSLDSARVADTLRNVFAVATPTAEVDVREAASPQSPTSGTLNGADANGDSAVATLFSPDATRLVMDRVLAALSFTSLAQRGPSGSPVGSFASTPSAAAGPHFGGTSSFAGHAAAAALSHDGYVVPWRTHAATSSGINGIGCAGPPRGTADGKGPQTQQRGDDDAAAGSVSLADADSGADSGDASVRQTLHLLFPRHETGKAATAGNTEPPAVAAFLGSRRLPDAPTGAQWTERDVMLAVQQEQRRMAHEGGGAVETERLEDVLRMSSA